MIVWKLFLGWSYWTGFMCETTLSPRCQLCLSIVCMQQILMCDAICDWFPGSDRRECCDKRKFCLRFCILLETYHFLATVRLRLFIVPVERVRVAGGLQRIWLEESCYGVVISFKISFLHETLKKMKKSSCVCQKIGSVIFFYFEIVCFMVYICISAKKCFLCMYIFYIIISF